VTRLFKYSKDPFNVKFLDYFKNIATFKGNLLKVESKRLKIFHILKLNLVNWHQYLEFNLSFKDMVLNHHSTIVNKQGYIFGIASQSPICEVIQLIVRLFGCISQ